MKILIPILMLLLNSTSHAASWPWSGQLKSDEQLIFFPAEAFYDAEHQRWTALIHGWVFEPNVLGEVSSLFRKSLDLSVDGNSETDSLFKQRARWFIVDNERKKRIKIQLGQQVFKMKKSGSNGHFNKTLKLNVDYVNTLKKTAADSTISFQAITPKKDKRIFRGELHLISPKGVSVISDIDDTIKVSNVIDKQELLANTFLRPFKAAPGMATLYKKWHSQQDTVFHYVSASPWQLYPVLSEFIQASAFPSGLFYMKSFRWKDSSFLNLFADPIEYKINIIESILQRYPQRQFILVGDSGEKDPEVYGKIARKFPKQIIRILIRKVGDNNSESRFTTAFLNLNQDIWQAFKTTQEIK